MQIGDEEQTFVGPVQRTGRIGDERDASDGNQPDCRRTRGLSGSPLARE